MTTPGKIELYERTIQVTKVFMSNDHNRYAIVKAINPEKPKEQQQEKIFKGQLDYPQIGSRYKVKFVQEYDATRKEHYFKIRHSELEFKNLSSQGLIEYLTREGPNIGDKRARELVEVFSTEVIDTLAYKPELVEAHRLGGRFDGLTKERLAQLSEWAQGEKEVEKIKQMLYGLQLTPSLISKMIQHFGHQVAAIVKNDPFRFGEVDGIGFATAWKIAKAAGCPKEDPNRIRYGIMHILSENEDNGHCCMEDKDLIYKSQQLLDVPQALVEKYLSDLIESGKLCNSQTNAQPMSDYPELFDIVE